MWPARSSRVYESREKLTFAKNVGVEADGGGGISAASKLGPRGFASAAWWQLGF